MSDMGLLSDTDPKAEALAAAVTRRSASNLWFVGQALSPAKRRLFEAAYATMRVIDDFVDDDFLARPSAERSRGRGAALARIDHWAAQAEAALSGATVDNGADETETTLFRALGQAAAGGDLPVGPWHALAGAMRADVQERPLTDWDDFEGYCAGATVAPAAVFLFVLQAGEERGLRTGLSADALFEQARDMAVFCYLVHIARDFRKDAERGGQLVTVPANAFAAHGLSRAAATADPAAAAPVLRDIVSRADDRRRAARAMADDLIPRLGRTEGVVLDALLSIYERLHDDLRRNADPNGGDRSGLTARLRASLAARLGLSLS